MPYIPKMDNKYLVVIIKCCYNKNVVIISNYLSSF